MGNGPGISFDAILYGSPQIAAENGLPNMRSFVTRFDGEMDKFLLPEYSLVLQKIGLDYATEVVRAFQAKHGRTGETISTLTESLEGADVLVGKAGAFRYRITMGGGVAYVINPIQAHDIPMYSVNNKPDGPWRGRSSNFYSPFSWFSPSRIIPWHQGGEESFGDDRSWYEDEGPMLAEAAMAELKLLASRVQLYWGHAANDVLPLTQPIHNEIIF